jgi:hypothetical protein
MGGGAWTGLIRLKRGTGAGLLIKWGIFEHPLYSPDLTKCLALASPPKEVFDRPESQRQKTCGTG